MKKTVGMYFQNKHMVSDMVRWGIDENEYHWEIRAEVCWYDGQISSLIDSYIKGRSTASSGTSQYSFHEIVHELNQRVLQLIDEAMMSNSQEE